MGHFLFAFLSIQGHLDSWNFEKHILLIKLCISYKCFEFLWAWKYISQKYLNVLEMYLTFSLMYLVLVLDQFLGWVLEGYLSNLNFSCTWNILEYIFESTWPKSAKKKKGLGWDEDREIIHGAIIRVQEYLHQCEAALLVEDVVVRL